MPSGYLTVDDIAAVTFAKLEALKILQEHAILYAMNDREFYDMIALLSVKLMTVYNDHSN